MSEVNRRQLEQLTNDLIKTLRNRRLCEQLVDQLEFLTHFPSYAAQVRRLEAKIVRYDLHLSSILSNLELLERQANGELPSVSELLLAVDA